MKLYRAYIDLGYKLEVISTDAKETLKSYKIIGSQGFSFGYGQLIPKDGMRRVDLTPEGAVRKLLLITQRQLINAERNVEIKKRELEVIESYLKESQSERS